MDGNYIKDSNISDSAKIYPPSRIIRSNLNNKSLVAERCDIADSHMNEHSEFGRNNLIRSVSIGNGSYTGSNCVIKNAIIQKFTSISWNVSIGGLKHSTEAASMYSNYWWNRTFGCLPEREEHSLQTIIGNDVWIGAGAIIIAGVKVGDGAVIGAGAVVTKDVESYSVVAGVPAKQIKKRFPEDIVNRLKMLSWWDWDREKISRYCELLSGKLNNESLSVLEAVAQENN